MFKLIKARSGVSPVIATILIFTILMTGIVLAFTWAYPILQNSQDEARIESIATQFLDLDDSIEALSHEGSGSQKSFTLEFEEGEMAVYNNFVTLTHITAINRSDGSPLYTLDLTDFVIGNLSFELFSGAQILDVGDSKYYKGTDIPYGYNLNTTTNRENSVIKLFRPSTDKYILSLYYRVWTVDTYDSSEKTLTVNIFGISIQSSDSFREYESFNLIAKQKEIKTQSEPGFTIGDKYIDVYLNYTNSATLSSKISTPMQEVNVLVINIRLVVIDITST